MSKYGKIFKEYVNNVNNGEYTVMSEYINNHTKIQLRHNLCGEAYWVRPKGFRDGNRCPFCNNKTKGAKNKTHEKFISDLTGIFGNDYIVLSRYKGVTKNIIVRHCCGHTYRTTPNKLLSGIKCRPCSALETGLRNRKTTEQFKDFINERLGASYTVTSDYIHSHVEVQLKHVCGHTWWVKPKHVNKSTRCSKCFCSKGEKSVAEALTKLGLTYEIQKKFKGLINKKQLSYDFYISSCNLLIEYNGIQHYVPTQFSKEQDGIKNFKNQMYNDELKRIYALKNHINLLILPYTVTSTSDILSLIEQYVTQESLPGRA